MVFTGNNGLQLCENVSADGDRIDAVFRMSAVAAFTGYFNEENVTGCAARAFLNADGANRKCRSNMKTGKYIRFQDFIELAVHHLFCAAAVFLSRLEQKHHIAAKFVFDLIENFCHI